MGILLYFRKSECGAVVPPPSGGPQTGGRVLWPTGPSQVAKWVGESLLDPAQLRRGFLGVPTAEKADNPALLSLPHQKGAILEVQMMGGIYYSSPLSPGSPFCSLYPVLAAQNFWNLKSSWCLNQKWNKERMREGWFSFLYNNLHPSNWDKCLQNETLQWNTRFEFQAQTSPTICKDFVITQILVITSVWSKRSWTESGGCDCQAEKKIQ